MTEPTRPSTPETPSTPEAPSTPDAPSPPNAPSTPDASSTSAASSTPASSFEQRMERFGHEAEEAGKRIGQQAEGAGRRLAENPAVKEAADTAARVWGLLVLGVGLWFFAEVTLGYDMPAIPWRDVWPLGLIVIGLAVVFRGMTRRRA
jgi:hypothetical protein